MDCDNCGRRVTWNDEPVSNWTHDDTGFIGCETGRGTHTRTDELLAELTGADCVARKY